MKNTRTAVGGLTGIVCAAFLQGCGGYHSPSSPATPTSVSISVNPNSVIAGRSTSLMWTATAAATAAPGLLGIAFGNDANSQPHNTLFFTAGINGGANGIYGRIDLTTP